MQLSKCGIALVFAAVACLGVEAASRLAGNTWAVFYGDPARSGTHKTKVTFTYYDGEGVQQEKTITASVSLTDSEDEDDKKTKIQEAMNLELGKPENKVGGQALASTSGSGNVMTVTPSASVSGAKIKTVKTEDNQTGEDDNIVKPGGKKGLAQVAPEGEIIGQTSDRGPSVFFVKTNLGTASVALTGNMTKLELLKALKAGLIAQDPGAEVWVDSDLLVLFVKLDDGDDGIFNIGAGSTDQGLVATCKVMIAD